MTHPTASPVPDAAYDPYNGVEHWEDETYLSARRRARIAWAVAAVASLIAFSEAIAIMGLTPLKGVEPIVITVDKTTGLANVSSTLDHISLDDDVAVTHALIYRYTRDREAYRHFDQKERINSVARMSKGPAYQDLAALYNDDNPLNPINRYGANVRIDTKIQSLVLHDGNRATIRYVKELQAGAGNPSTPSNHVATLIFGFDRTGEMTLEERWENPTGFFVREYVTDAEAS